jgi:hypothetical protein
VGGSPVSFVDGNGKQFSVPLTYISFPAAGGAPVLASWPGWGTGASATQDAASFAAWVTSLVGQSILESGAVPPPPPAFTVAAAHPGSTGNDITVSFGAVTPGATPAATTVAVTVSTQQVYALTLSDPVTGIAAMIGTAPGGGSKPGLAYLATPPTQLPSDAPASPFSGSPAQWSLVGSGGGLLQATVDGADAAHIMASITGAQGAAFTLTLTWSKTQTVALTALTGAGNPFAYLVTFTAPPGGIVNPPAAQSSITLLGGADPATTTSPATTAQATVVSAG